MNTTNKQACLLWDELRNAMCGKASHGYEAEIYAYTLNYNIQLPNRNQRLIDLTNDYIIAAKCLVEIINLFVTQYPNIYVLIDNIDYIIWGETIQHNFQYRVKVQIISKIK